ncbi:MAG: FeoB-associated Cys-rich membrane protein [Blautia sp.]|nr:FeoB-associated Cys-rich membrane protein [Blautia sp.]MDY5031356.1 FeoB-associated Cys-rich membrane protein [Blautia sp.]
MGTVIVLLILAGVIGLAIRSMVKDRKAGKSLQCGQNCSHCGGHCHHVQKNE